jgi:hypothetical protein
VERRTHRIEEWIDLHPPVDSIDAYFLHSLLMCEDCYPDTLSHYRTLRLNAASAYSVEPSFFLREYVWIVFASGFNTRILSERIDELLACYHDVMLDMTDDQIDGDFEWRWKRVEKVIANRRKHDSIRDVVKLMAQAWREKDGRGGWWLAFFERIRRFKDGLPEPNWEGIEALPGIGPITKYHVARNVGFDVIKPDRHLVRLAERFEFDSPELMCSYLSGLYDERIGVVDLVLFYAGSTWGTLDINNANDTCASSRI